MTDLWVSLAVIVAAVLLSEAVRRSSARLFAGAPWIYLVEAASTFQLCSCTHEIKLLAESGRLEPPLLGPALTYTITVVHLITFQAATCNPIAVVESFCRGSRSGRAAVIVICCQFAAAVAAQFFAGSVWSLGLSDVHVRHQKFGYRCFDPLGGSLLEAAAVELACAFFIQAAVLHLHKVDEKLRVHFIAAVVTALVAAGGSISGAVFNPVLAFSIQFPCSGHTYPEYCFVYWLGPVLGVTSCILLFEKIIPFLSGKSTARLDVPAVHKQKMQ
uniref:aquaporin-11-like n=1 Tax=Solea senegalensis TaxID=28829 RepID=UPI001CD8B106|nr:aquaporin-11-like [Solea senegalensis]